MFVGATIPLKEIENMLKEPTLEKLQALRLGAMSAAWDEQQRHPTSSP